MTDTPIFKAEAIESCETCKYWVRHLPVKSMMGDLPVAVGNCQRRAPIIDKVGYIKFPVTFAGNWCGDYEHIQD